MFGKKKQIPQDGVTAWATITEVKTRWQSGSANGFGQLSSQTDHDTVSVRVEPDGQEPFEVTVKQTFPGLDPMKGWQCKVTYDPADHSNLTIIDNSITPPGIDHTRAERAADMRSEMMGPRAAATWLRSWRI
jgi:hypothetical protein